MSADTHASGHAEPPRLLGAVLAGGGSRRFGRPKSAEPFLGVPLVQRAAAAVREAVGSVVVVSAHPVPAADGLDRIADRVPGAGPLAGLHAALLAAEERGMDGVLLLGCDLPLVTGDVLATLVAHAGPEAVTAPEREGGGVEHLCAVYRVGARAEVERRLAGTDHSLQGLIEALGVRVVSRERFAAAGPEPFLNVNTPAELARARSLRPREKLPAIVCVVGKKKSGKTTTVLGLVRALADRGHRVMTAKHGHHFRLDTEGTDSWRHRHEAGALRVLLAGPDEVALAGAWPPGGERPLETLVARHLADADIVVAEGFKRSGAPRIEVFRTEAHAEPLYGADPGADRLYLAVVTDAPDFQAHVPVLGLGDADRFARLADLVEDALLGGSSSPPSKPLP